MIDRNMQRKLTIDEKILLAATGLSKEEFTAEDLIVVAFKLYPADFGLMNYPHYPDSNKVLTQITTAGRGLQKRGWLAQTGTKRYKLTDEGYRHAKLLHPEQDSGNYRAQDRDIAEILKFWLTSDAYSKLKLGKFDSVSEREALAHWHLTSGASAARTNRLLAVAESAINLLTMNIKAKQPTPIYHGHSITIVEAQNLLDLHKQLKNKFDKELRFLVSQKR